MMATKKKAAKSKVSKKKASSKTKKSSSLDKKREALKKRQEHNTKNKGKKNNSGERYLNFDEIDEVKFIDLKSGKQEINIIPYEITTKKHPQLDVLEIGDMDYLLDIWAHRFIGPAKNSFICLKETYGKACPICEERDTLIESDASEKITDALKPQRRVIYNVQHLNGNDPDEIVLFETSYAFFETELLEEAQEQGFVNFADPEEGFSITFRAVSTKFKKATFFKFKKFDFEEREPLEEEVLNEAISLDSLLVVPTYEEIKTIFYGADEEYDEEDEELEEDEVEEIEEDEEEDEEEEEDEVEEKVKAKKSKAKSKKKSKAKSKKSKCPNNYNFGTDCDEYEECEDCDLWDECSDKFKELNEEEDDEEDDE